MNIDLSQIKSVTINELSTEEKVHFMELLKHPKSQVVISSDENTWIPVSEKLPEIATRCLVQLSDGYITIGEYFSIEKWCLIETSYAIAFPKEVVIAWQPLPEAYKEAENENGN